jgi:transcriptional regulator of acetoin/glycerol metabolism
VAWLNELRGALSVGSGTVIIRRVNLVPGSVQMALGALLGTAVRRGWRCLATRIYEALSDTGGRKAEAAQLLGISRSTLYRKLRASGIDLENTAF